MNENPETKDRLQPPPQQQQSEIIRNEFPAKDSTVVVDEADRTVLLTDDETIIIEKEPKIQIAPKSRPRKVNLGMFGTTEYVIVGLGLLSIAATVLFYVFLVMPARTQLNARKAERDRVEKDLTSTSGKFKDFTTTEEQVARLIGSVDDFEARHLYVASSGRTALYQRLNTLIAGYGLVNTAGPDYAPLEMNQRQGQTEADRGRAKYQSLFPGAYVTMTVEGSYQNLRRFLRDIETSEQFMVISAVSLEPSETEQQSSSADPTAAAAAVTTQPNNQPTVTSPNQPYARPNQPGQGFSQPMMNNPTMPGQPMMNPAQQQQTTSRPPAPRGRTVGGTVSLRVELAAYFKRNLTTPFIPAPQEQQQ